MNSNRYFLQAFTTTHDVGLFSIAYKIASISTMLITAFFLAWEPVSYKIIKHKTQHYMYDFIARFFIFFFSIIVLLLTFFAKESLVILTTKKYYPAFSIVGYIALGGMTLYLNGILSIGIIISKKTIYKSIAIVSGAISSTFVYIVFIPKYSIYAASAGLLLGYLTASIMIYFFSQRLFKLPYKLRRILISYLITLSVITSYFVLSPKEFNISAKLVGIKLFIISITAILLFITSFNNNERLKMKSNILSSLFSKNARLLNY